MNSGFYDAAGGMSMQLNRLNIVSNNLANANTLGFKQNDTVTGDFMRVYQEVRDNLPLKNQTFEAASFYNRTMNRVPKLVEEYTDFTKGVIQETGSPLDVALMQEDLFFAVKTPNGIRLTRDGSFTLNADGEMIDKQGNMVLSTKYFETKEPIVLPLNKDVVEIDYDGKVQTLQTVPGPNTFVEEAQLLVIQPNNLKNLKKEGENYFIPEVDDFKNVQLDNDAVLQGSLEKSNVNVVKEMMHLVEANRMFNMYQKTMDMQMNTIAQDAINKLASVR